MSKKEETSREFEKKWFKKKNKKCLQCVRLCKQSDKVIVINCLDYEEKK